MDNPLAGFHLSIVKPIVAAATIEAGAVREQDPNLPLGANRRAFLAGATAIAGLATIPTAFPAFAGTIAGEQPTLNACRGSVPIALIDMVVVAVIGAKLPSPE